MKTVLTVERLKALMTYDPETGKFTRIMAVSNRPLGEVTPGLNAKGYQRIAVDGQMYFVHRLAWFYTYGEWPTALDHIDGARTHNWIANLRECTMSENGQNLHGPARAKSGLRGAYWVEAQQHWKAAICVNRQQIFIGVFPTADLAHAAYLGAKKIHHKFYRG